MDNALTYESTTAGGRRRVKKLTAFVCVCASWVESFAVSQFHSPAGLQTLFSQFELSYLRTHSLTHPAAVHLPSSFLYLCGWIAFFLVYGICENANNTHTLEMSMCGSENRCQAKRVINETSFAYLYVHFCDFIFSFVILIPVHFGNISWECYVVDDDDGCCCGGYSIALR